MLKTETSVKPETDQVLSLDTETKNSVEEFPNVTGIFLFHFQCWRHCLRLNNVHLYQAFLQQTAHLPHLKTHIKQVVQLQE